MGFRRFCRFVVESQLWGVGGGGGGRRLGGGEGLGVGGEGCGGSKHRRKRHIYEGYFR